MGCHLWGRTEWDMTEVTQQQLYNVVFQFDVTFCSTIYITMCDPCGKLSGSETEGMRTGEEGTTASQLEEG